MVSSTSRKIFSLAISLLVVVISLTGIASGATAPTVTKLGVRYTPGFSGAPGKMARDAAGNFYATDFWGKGVVKLDRKGVKIDFIATNGRPSAVAVLPDSRLVVAIAAPQPKVAFYSQLTKAEIAAFPDPAPKMYRPVAITVDGSGNIYVLDSGDSSGLMNGACDTFVNPGTSNVGKVRVYDSTGAYLSAYGSRTATNCVSVTGGEFKQPSGIAYEKKNNQIVVVDTNNSRLQFFNTYSNGSGYLTSMGASASNDETVYGTGALYLGNPVDAAF